MELKQNLIKINEDLCAQGSKLRVEQRGAKLNLRGPLPCRKNKNENRTQRISLQLKANNSGLQEALKIIQLIELQLEHKQFDWNNWATEKPKLNSKRGNASLEKAVEEFKQSFFLDPQRKKSQAGTKTTWSSAYLPYLRRLIKIGNEMNCALDQDLLYKALSSYKENSRSRQQCGITLGLFARHFGLPLSDNWKALANGYGLNRARFRQLPSDNQIKEAWEQIPNLQWRLVYGLMATYGLRNHEVFFCDLNSLRKDGDKVLRILPSTKTGEHEAWPFHPQWVKYFGLEELGHSKCALPKIKTDLNETTLQQTGKRVAEQFRRYKLPLTPYDLRHAWAIRTIHIGLPDTVAAKMMGHSVAIHTQTYHHWITRRDQQQAVDAALAKNNSY